MTPSSTSPKRGEIHLALISFSDGSAAKRRPVVVLSVDAVHSARRDVLIVPLTTNLSAPRFGDYVLTDWSGAGLPRPSMAKGVVDTIERRSLASHLGELNAGDLNRIEDSIRAVLGL